MGTTIVVQKRTTSHINLMWPHKSGAWPLVLGTVYRESPLNHFSHTPITLFYQGFLTTTINEPCTYPCAHNTHTHSNNNSNNSNNNTCTHTHTATTTTTHTHTPVHTHRATQQTYGKAKNSTPPTKRTMVAAM